MRTNGPRVPPDPPPSQAIAIFGTGPALIDRLAGLKEELGLTGIAAELNPGGLLSTEQEMRSLQILTHQVMPAFK